MKQGQHFLFSDKNGTHIKATTRNENDIWYSLEIDDEGCEHHDPFLSDLGLRKFEDLVKDVESGYFILIHAFTPIRWIVKNIQTKGEKE